MATSGRLNNVRPRQRTYYVVFYPRKGERLPATATFRADTHEQGRSFVEFFNITPKGDAVLVRRYNNRDIQTWSIAQ